MSQVLVAQPEVERIGMTHKYAEAEHQTAQLHPEIIWLDRTWPAAIALQRSAA
jgi:chemotaxis response regulator CheB